MNQETCEPRWSTIADRLIQFRYLCLAIAAIIGCLAYSISGRFVLERRLESMFRADDPVLANYQQLSDQFGGNEVILVVFEDDEFWDSKKDKLHELTLLHAALERVEGIRGVMDLSVVDRLIQQIESPMNLFNGQVSSKGIFGDSALTKSMLELFTGTTHSVKGPWIAVACLLDPVDRSTKKRSMLIQEVRATVQELLPDRKTFLVGEPMMVEEGFEMIEADGQRLGWISSSVLAVLMLVVYRNVRWTMLTLLVVQWSLIVTRAICVLAKWELTMVSSMLVAIVTVIGIATTMHWLFGYRKRLRTNATHSQALRDSLRQLIRPIAWSCITDALAFASLMAARVEPVRDYGLMMAVASLVTLLAILLIGPGFASVGIQLFENAPQNFESSRLQNDLEQRSWTERLLSQGLHVALQNRFQTLALLVVWMILVLIGSVRLTVETDFLRNFRQGSSLVQGYSIVEQQMGGAGVWDVLLPAPDRLTIEYLASVSELEDRLRRLEHGLISKVISLADAEAAARNSALLKNLPLDLRLSGMQAAMPSFYSSLITPSDNPLPRTLRLMLRSSERLSVNDKLKLIASVEDCCLSTVSSKSWQKHFSQADNRLQDQRPPIVTGYYVLLSQLVKSVVSDQWICFSIAALAILIALRIATGSWSLSLVALVPNTLPALGAIAALGLCGLKMNLGAAMIAAVSIGLSVDSSLHYLIDYQRWRRVGLSSIDALERSQCDVGMPVLFSTIALVVGFGSLSFSDFLPTVVFGTLAAITMTIGLIGNLWWLPVLVYLVDRRA